jgi:hypothetical protein
MDSAFIGTSAEYVSFIHLFSCWHSDILLFTISGRFSSFLVCYIIIFYNLFKLRPLV